MSHIDDTSQLTRKLLLYMDLGLANNEIQLIAEAAKYHDIGKIYIPDHILYKPGELTKEEYKIVQQHTVIGHDMIMNSNLNRELKKYAAEIALHHHERIDGSGYPDNLLGKEIKDWIQVVALADVYTALRSKRVYKPAYSKEKAGRPLDRPAFFGRGNWEVLFGRMHSQLRPRVKLAYASMSSEAYMPAMRPPL